MQRMMVTCVIIMIIRWHSHKAPERGFTFSITFSFFVCISHPYVCGTFFVELFSTSEFQYSATRLKVTLSKAISIGLNFLGTQKKIIKWVKLLLWNLGDYLLVFSLHRVCYKYILPASLEYPKTQAGLALCVHRKMYYLPCKSSQQWFCNEFHVWQHLNLYRCHSIAVEY